MVYLTFDEWCRKKGEEALYHAEINLDILAINHPNEWLCVEYERYVRVMEEKAYTVWANSRLLKAEG